MDNVTSILARLAGVFIFASFVSALFYGNDQVNKMIRAVKSEYVEDAVYSQVDNDYSEDGISQVTDKQLRSILANGVDYTVIILDITTQSKYVVYYEQDGVRVDYYLYNAMDVDGTYKYSLTGLDSALSAVSSGEYSVTQEYDLGNNVRRVIFRKVAGYGRIQ